MSGIEIGKTKSSPAFKSLTLRSDDHPGLKAARSAVLAGVATQRCQYHLQQNASSYVPRKAVLRQGSRTHPGGFQRPRPLNGRNPFGFSSVTVN